MPDNNMQQNECNECLYRGKNYEDDLGKAIK